jgi:hypothetical protein
MLVKPTDISDPVLFEDSLEEQIRWEFSEAEYSEGNGAKEQNVELRMEGEEVYRKVYVIVQKARQNLSKKKKKKKILQ